MADFVHIAGRPDESAPWNKLGVAPIGAGSIPMVQPTTSYQYRFRVFSDVSRRLKSEQIITSVLAATPSVVTDLNGQSASIASGGAFSFTVGFSDGTIAWYEDDGEVSGETGTTYSGTAGTGPYTRVITASATNGAGTTFTTFSATLDVSAPAVAQTHRDAVMSDYTMDGTGLINHNIAPYGSHERILLLDDANDAVALYVPGEYQEIGGYTAAYTRWFINRARVEVKVPAGKWEGYVGHWWRGVKVEETTDAGTHHLSFLSHTMEANSTYVFATIWRAGQVDQIWNEAGLNGAYARIVYDLTTKAVISNPASCRTKMVEMKDGTKGFMLLQELVQGASPTTLQLRSGLANAGATSYTGRAGFGAYMLMQSLQKCTLETWELPHWSNYHSTFRPYSPAPTVAWPAHSRVTWQLLVDPVDMRSGWTALKDTDLGDTWDPDNIPRPYAIKADFYP